MYLNVSATQQLTSEFIHLPTVKLCVHAKYNNAQFQNVEYLEVKEVIVESLLPAERDALTCDSPT